jgi:hypothetical protein
VVSSDSRVFVTFPRFRDGIPITLGVRSLLKRSIDGSPMIEPYPNYSWHDNVRQNCDQKILSVFRIAVSSYFALTTTKNFQLFSKKNL